ncbi:MAG: lysophospholipid acyltransferase family protein [Legionellales bacterium]|nr:lysophospholipid acyltransferase family protein [Legionellales bacterium]
MKKTSQRKQKRFQGFINCLARLGVYVLHGLAILPPPLKRGLQRFISWLLLHLPTEMRSVAKRNIEACFPELNPHEQKKMLQSCFDLLATTLVEGLNMPWPSKTNIFPQIGRIEGLHYIKQALANQQGVLILFPHFLAVYLVGFLLIPHVEFPFSLMYHPPKNPVLADFFKHNIAKYCSPAFTRKEIRPMIKHLREGNVVWYAPDLEPNKKAHSVFAPFFNIPASTYTTTARIAQLSGAATIPIAFYRRDNEAVYDVCFHPPLANFPSENPIDDAAQVNQVIENIVRVKPEQYLWTYKRFSRNEKGQKIFYTRQTGVFGFYNSGIFRQVTRLKQAIVTHIVKF